jgi:hypothetical protein
VVRAGRVVRQAGQKSDPSPKQYKGIGRLVFRAGRVVRQAGSELGQARDETRRTRNKQRLGKIGARKTTG